MKSFVVLALAVGATATSNEFAARIKTAAVTTPTGKAMSRPQGTANAPAPAPLMAQMRTLGAGSVAYPATSTFSAIKKMNVPSPAPAKSMASLKMEMEYPTKTALPKSFLKSKVEKIEGKRVSIGEKRRLGAPAPVHASSTHGPTGAPSPFPSTW